MSAYPNPNFHPNAALATRSSIGKYNPLLVRSPIPGLVLAILVQAGDVIRIGQPICVIEAMKMKNTIRSRRDGKIKALLIHLHQHVSQQEVLLEFEEVAGN